MALPEVHLRRARVGEADVHPGPGQRPDQGLRPGHCASNHGTGHRASRARSLRRPAPGWRVHVRVIAGGLQDDGRGSRPGEGADSSGHVLRRPERGQVRAAGPAAGGRSARTRSALPGPAPHGRYTMISCGRGAAACAIARRTVSGEVPASRTRPSASSPARASVFGPRAPIRSGDGRVRRPVQGDAVQVHVPSRLTVTVSPLQQRPDRASSTRAAALIGEAARAPTWSIQSSTPCPSGRDEPAGEQPGQRRDLHGRQRRVAQRRRHQAQADPQRAAPRQRRGRRGQAALQEAVLPQPQVIEAGGLGRRRRTRAAAPAGSCGRNTMPTRGAALPGVIPAPPG